MSRMNHCLQSRDEIYNTYEWVMSHIWMCPVTRMNTSYHTYEWVTWFVCLLMSHIPMCHVTSVNIQSIWIGHVACVFEYFLITSVGKGDVYGCAHGVSHVTRRNPSCHTYEWFVSHTCMLYVWSEKALSMAVHLEWVMSHIWMSHVTHMHVVCLIWNGTVYVYAPRVSHVTYVHVVCLVWLSIAVNLEWVMSHTCDLCYEQVGGAASGYTTRVSHGTHMNESCHTYEWVMSDHQRGGRRCQWLYS